jgi:glucan phosphoethanolaminetransferase (alkaline phosphatase superfamily)
MQLEIIFVLIALVLIVLAWRVWIVKDRESQSGIRKILFPIGLICASLALAIYVAFVIHTYRVGGFKENFASLLVWTRPSFWISVAAIVLCIAGKGRSRVWGLVSSIFMTLLWILPVWGM